MNFGDFFAKMKENLKQVFNLKSINKEIKILSEQFLSLTKKDNSEILVENNYDKYELSYSPISYNDDIIETNNLLYLALVSFHQKKGSVIELTFPPIDKLINEPNDELKNLVEENNSINNNIEGIINNINSQLVNYSLMDGIHLVDNDTQIYILHNYKKPIYCLSYYVQVKTGNGYPQKEDSFQENVRECIQKAVCIVTLKPFFTHKLLYQNFYTYLTCQMNAFMEQESLNEKTKLKILYDILSKKITLIDLNKDQWLLNIRKLFCLLRGDLITILKLILCEQNIIVYSQVPSNVSLFIICLLSILPGEICQELSNYDMQNGTPFKIFHENYLVYPLFTLFDLSPLIEKIKNNENFHYICGTTNLLVAQSKNINYACFINVDELTVTYRENLNDDLTYLNSYENKIIDEINKKINHNIEKEGIIKDYEYSKKFNVDEKWIIFWDKLKKENIKEYEFITKKIRKHFYEIAFDINYLMKEIKDINKNNDQNKAQLILKEINEDINNKFIKYLGKSIDNSNNKEEKSNEEKSKEENNTNDTSPSNKKKLILPRIDEVISEPYIYLLNSKLSFSIKNQIDMGLIASPANEEIPEDLNSPLSNLNVLTFVSFWIKTKNFKNWWNTAQNNDKIINLSKLNSARASVTKLYDYENNEYNGYMKYGKKNGKGKFIFNDKEMIYVGDFKNDLREGKGNLFSVDNQYLYDGDWKNDKYNGSGSLVSPVKGKYVGEFKDGIFEGNGYLIDNEKNVYNGKFKEGKKFGEGELSMSNGNKYIGMFKDDKYNGKGKLLDSKGNIIQEGIFKNGEFVPSKKKKDDSENEDIQQVKNDTQENSDKISEKTNDNNGNNIDKKE